MLNWVVPMLVKFPLESIRCVPADAPVFTPVVPLRTVPVIVLAVVIVPNPEAIEPDASAPTVVRDEVVTPDPRVLPVSTVVPDIWIAGVPLFTLIKPNLADADVAAPTRRSSVGLFGYRVPEAIVQ